MITHFNGEIAKRYGVEEAILIDEIRILGNIGKDSELLSELLPERDGRQFVRLSEKSEGPDFPYWGMGTRPRHCMEAREGQGVGRGVARRNAVLLPSHRRGVVMDYNRRIAEELRAIARLFIVAICESSDNDYDPKMLEDYAYGVDDTLKTDQ